MKLAPDGTTQLAVVVMNFEVPYNVFMSAGLLTNNQPMSGWPPGKAHPNTPPPPTGGTTSSPAPDTPDATLNFLYPSGKQAFTADTAQTIALASFVRAVWEQVYAAGYPAPVSSEAANPLITDPAC